MFKLIPLKESCLPKGFFLDGVKADLKKDGFDVGFIYSDNVCEVSALFTTNRFQAAPIKHFQKHKITKTNFLLVNSKNANAMTGKKGIEDIEEILEAAKYRFSDIKNPIMSSTGVIGVPLPKEKIKNAVKKFDLTSKNLSNFSKSIMTTDSFPKTITFKIELENNKSFTITGIAKGAGMINPALATMLCFIITDADIPKEDMDELLRKNVETSFNAISVDGDTSTNDTVMLFSNKKSGVYDKAAFDFALEKVMHHLALQIVKDGEGAKKLVSFNVTGAKNEIEAKTAAKALSNSLLVKTAIFGEDPNWGRIASTIGACGIECYEDSLSISFEDILVYNRGEVLFTKDIEKSAHEIMKRDEFTINCDLGIGSGKFRAYGCDLSYDYVKINAEYRT